MTKPRERTPREMRDDLLKLVYSKRDEMTPAQLNTALKTLAELERANPTPQPQEDRYVADEIGGISNLDPKRRLAIMEEWRAKFVREIEKIDRIRTQIEHEMAA